jgi:hypothetical protein
VTVPVGQLEACAAQWLETPVFEETAAAASPMSTRSIRKLAPYVALLVEKLFTAPLLLTLTRFGSTLLLSGVTVTATGA